MIEIATFAAGCFWGVEDAFIAVPGVISTRVGYCGGITEHPTYHDVCHHDTGHAEAVEVTFETLQVSYNDLLKVFWECHDPTQVNRQGPDYGEQYRSAIFFHDVIQQEVAITSKYEFENSKILHHKIATQIIPAVVFWEAEAYHQKYHQKNGGDCGF